MILARNGLRLGEKLKVVKLMVYVVTLMLALSLLLARRAVAQEGPASTFDLVGVVVDDETGEPLVGAFVSLAGSEWGSVTNDEGRFRLPETLSGSLALAAEQLGYESLEWRREVAADAVPVELRLTPKPVVLDGLRVVTDRFRWRRRASPTTVRAFGRSELATSSDRTALDFVASRAGSTRLRCGAASASNNCLYIRGRVASPVVYVDEHPVMGGLDYLDVLAPHELQLVEIFGNGRHIRVYTQHFMEYAAEQRLQPIALLF